MKKLAAVFTALLMLVAGAAVSAGCGDTRETFDGVVVVNNGDAIYHEDAMKEGAEEPVHLKIGFTEAGFGREWKPMPIRGRSSRWTICTPKSRTVRREKRSRN